jgi:hypothetical protein
MLLTAGKSYLPLGVTGCSLCLVMLGDRARELNITSTSHGPTLWHCGEYESSEVLLFHYEEVNMIA